MTEMTFIVVDRDSIGRNKLVRLLSTKGYVVPLDTLEELGDRWPEDAWILVHDEAGQVESALRTLAEAARSYPVVAFGKSPQMSRVVELINGECAGFFEWPTDEDEFWRTFVVLQKQVPLRNKAQQIATEAQRKLALLTEREREVAFGISQGLSTKELSGPLGISPRTIEVHRSNIFAKLQTRNMASLVRLVVEADLIPEAA